METWEDLDSESKSDKDDVDEDAKVVVGLLSLLKSSLHILNWEPMSWKI